MKVVSLLIIFSVLLVSTLLAVVLTISNAEQVNLIIGFTEYQLSSGQLLVFAFVCGAAIGLAGMLISILLNQIRTGLLHRRIFKLQKELELVKSNGIGESV